uniref:NADH-ubiquinone oxidoreductase chain 2 n=1 Tax=Psilotreta sp. XG-2021 TaxID=2996739 RepID=A0A9E8RT96_9NEOP|nr:NADH dehydrogenase subunit 2 [Psilotreta sp. XG-2021]
MNNFIFLLILIFSTMFSISSNSWINMWMGMEINLMMFIPLMIQSSYKISSQSMCIYFLIQAFASLNFIFVIFMKMNFQFNFFMIKNLIFNTLINITLLMKMGASPFHAWFPLAMKNLTWINCLILSTWQKIIPMIIISYCFILKILIISIIFSTIMGSILGLNQTNLKLIMSFSSINHIGWMLSALLINMFNWIIYISIYSLINIMIMISFKIFNLNYLHQIYNLNFPIMMKMFFITNFLSLGGLPPFLGFFPKWLVIYNLIHYKMFTIMFIMIMTSLINLFFYLRINFSCFMLNIFQTKWIKNNFFKYTFITTLLSFFSMFMLISITSLYQII